MCWIYPKHKALYSTICHIFCSFTFTYLLQTGCMFWNIYILYRLVVVYRRQICSNYVMPSRQHGPTLLWNISDLQNQWPREFRLFWRQKGSNEIHKVLKHLSNKTLIYLDYMSIQPPELIHVRNTFGNDYSCESFWVSL